MYNISILKAAVLFGLRVKFKINRKKIIMKGFLSMIGNKIFSRMLYCILTISVTLCLIPRFDLQSGASEFPLINSDSYVLIEADSGQVLIEKNMNQRMYPASITKIMTILLACENANLDSVVTMSEYATVTTVPRDSSHIALTTGQNVRMEDLMYGAMLASANDACNGIAEFISGSIDQFAVLMTDRAKEIGAVNTNFANANGLFDEDHYTTAYDMALITREAVKNELFTTIFGTVRYEIAPDNIRKEVFPVATGMDLLKPTNPLYYDGIIGGKTGYIPEAGYTGVVYAEKNGMKLIAVTMSADSAADRFSDLASLLDYGFENFSKKYITAEMFSPETVSVVENDCIVATVTVYTNNEIYYVLHNDVDEASVIFEKNIPETYSQFNIQPSLTLSLTDNSTPMYKSIGTVSLKFTVQQHDEPTPLNPDVDVVNDSTKKTFKIPVFLKIIIIIVAIFLIFTGIIIIMFLVSNAKRKHRDRMRRLRRQAMYEESRSDMIIRDSTENKKLQFDKRQ